ncbi:hypothetical protein I1A62_29920 [Rhodococcus sp. USK10]|uniref:hypothetical protein n=1 Tax=Rhodococcus sp. USK10 TaxID=2789739 RepID=UPI001C5EA714|nr:hypothetical protein [Rhodococcus sp. USK10]QYB01452.1 hypothetical protein I1A62_29920 [Rhodococcus sp. USK10]
MADHDHGPESRCGLRCPAIEPPIDLDWLETHVKAAVEGRLVGRQVAWTSSPELVLALVTELRVYRQRDREDEEWNRRVDEDNVRCLDCDLRHGEREQYRCTKASGAHTYVFSEDELLAAREGGK